MIRYVYVAGPITKGNRFVNVRNALLRLPGESSGSDREVAHAQDHGIPVFFDIGDLLALRVMDVVK